MTVVEKILELMESKQITARKLTTDLGLSNSAITEWKKGKAKPSLEAVIKIAGYFGVTTDYLLVEDTGFPKPAEEIHIQGCNEAPCQDSSLENVVVSAEEEKLLKCYHRLSRADQEYILCKLIVLEREAID